MKAALVDSNRRRTEGIERGEVKVVGVNCAQYATHMPEYRLDKPHLFVDIALIVC